MVLAFNVCPYVVRTDGCHEKLVSTVSPRSPKGRLRQVSVDARVAGDIDPPSAKGGLWRQVVLAPFSLDNGGGHAKAHLHYTPPSSLADSPVVDANLIRLRHARLASARASL